MKKTKKNATLRIAVVLLAVTLLSTGLLGGTLAKYVTAGTTYDTARVAKWGVTITADSTDELFKTTYATTDTSYTGDLTVSATTEVLAPGTSGKAVGFTIAGTPEVASRLSFTVNETDSKLTGWTDGTDPYEPVKWTLTVGGVKKVEGGTFTALIAGLKAQTADFAPNTDLASGLSYEISWEWPFSTSEANDAKDTYLGDLATAPTVTLDFGITITQID